MLGIKTHPRIGDLLDPIDLAIVATPAPMVPDLIGECVEAGVRAVVVISAGFREIRPEGGESNGGSWNKRSEAGFGSSARTAWG